MQGRLKLLAMAVAVFVAVASAPAQTPSASNANTEPAADYSKESFIMEKVRTVATFESDGTDSRVVTGAVRVQSEAGVEHWGVLTVSYSTSNEQVEIGHVRVRKPDGTVVETPPDSAQDVTSELMRAAPFYSDIHEKHIAVKGLSVGDLLEYQITTRLRTPLIPNQFWFAYDFEKTNVLLDEELEISVPKGHPVKVKSPELAPTVAEVGERRVYTWKTGNRERKKNDEPRLKIPPPAILVSSFQSWEEVGRWWNGLEQASVTPTPEIRAKAAELTRDAATREEKIRALYYYVATHFRYISISFGIGRYQPRAALDVLKNEYGDCKDKHTLLASLLQAVGIEVYPALMNSARQIDPDVPSPAQFDHVVSAVPETPQGSKLIWLDTTAEVGPFEYLTFNLRGKQALLIPDTMPARLVTTPADLPFKNFTSFEMDAKLSDAGVLEGKAERVYRGDAEVLVRTLFRQVAQAQWKDLVQGISAAAGFGGDVSEVEAGAPEATKEPYRFSYKYTRKDYSDWANHRITPPIGFVGFPEIKDDPKRTQPILLGAPQESTFIAKVELPKGYAPSLLTGVNLVRDFAEYHSSYAFKEGVFTAEVHVAIKKPELPLAALGDYQSFQKAISDDLNRYTQLSSAPASLYTMTPSSNAEANALLQEALEAARRKDLDREADLLARAVKLDDHYGDAWTLLVGVQLDRGRSDEAIASLRRIIELYPKDTRYYRWLAFVYQGLHRPEDAIPVLRACLEQNSNDKAAHYSLGDALLSLKRYREAVPELEAAVPPSEPSAALEISLAEAYLGIGDNEKAVMTFKKTADRALTPYVWNDVAYKLADHNLSLPDAQRYAEKAVKSLENDAAQVSLAKLRVPDLVHMTELAQFWDTLGWVYFREGDLTKAQKYLEAAWNLQQRSVVGEHLAQVYEKQGEKAAAIHQYALARELTDSGDFGPPPPLRRRDGSFVSSSELKSGQKSPVDELLGMRRTELGNLLTKPGSAEFFVLLESGGKVGDAQFISGDDSLRSLSKVLASLRFKAPLPDDAPVKLVRRGVLTCTGSSRGCDFTLFTVDSVHSTQ